MPLMEKWVFLISNERKMQCRKYGNTGKQKGGLSSPHNGCISGVCPPSSQPTAMETRWAQAPASVLGLGTRGQPE